MHVELFNYIIRIFKNPVIQLTKYVQSLHRYFSQQKVPGMLTWNWLFLHNQLHACPSGPSLSSDCLFSFYSLPVSSGFEEISSGSSFVILLKPVIIVEVLCKSAEVAGCITPATPRAIRVPLKASMNL